MHNRTHQTFSNQQLGGGVSVTHTLQNGPSFWEHNFFPRKLWRLVNNTGLVIVLETVVASCD